MIKRPKGTQDIIPGVIEKWHFIEEQIKKICSEFGYREIRPPIFEYTELFQRGVGESTDIVNKEMYTFWDKGNRSITLRPEGTASVCRAYVENKLHGSPKPLKLYYLGPMFRYENTQAGRYRQFHQFGCEVLGSDDPLVDAEVISLVWELFRRLSLKYLEVHINSVGCQTCRAEYRKLLQVFLEERRNKLCRDCQSRFERNPMRILDCKNTNCQSLTTDAPTTLQNLCEECQEHFNRVLALLTASNIPYKINPRMVRGLDYYQKTAFEIMAEGIGAQSAICGGGRYDRLVEEIGGPSTPGIGFAVGIERIIALLENQNTNIATTKEIKVLVAAIGENPKIEGFKLLTQLRQCGISALMDLTGRGLKGQMKYADREKIRYVLILGDDELAENVVIVKDMILGEQEKIPMDSIIKYMRNEIDKTSCSD
jgi:histidyl-tRNA synthetase